jgi:Tfp pilus assembly protein PilV
MRSLPPGRNEQRGFVLVGALVIAILYLGLVEMLWMEASLRIREAQRFRARVEAQTLAENAVELAAQRIVLAASSSVEAELPEGTMQATMVRNEDDTFVIEATARGSRLLRYEARVTLQGRIDGTDIRIERAAYWP